MEILDVEAAVVKYAPSGPGGGGTPDDNTVSTQKIVNKAVVNGKLDDMPLQSIKCNPTGGTAIPQDYTLLASKILGRGPTGNLAGLGVSAALTISDTTIGRAALTGDVTAAADSNALTIGNNVVGNVKAAQMPAQTIKVNATGAQSNAQDLAIAASSIVGRGPTGSIVGLTVGGGLTLSDTGLGRAAFTGDVTAGANANALIIAPNAVTNAKAAQMATKTLKGNSTGGTANAEDLTVTGALSFEAGKLKAKGNFSFSMLWDTQTTTTAPGTSKINLNAANTILVVDVNSLAGRNLDTFFNSVLRGQFKVMSNNITSTAAFRFNVTGSASDLGDFWIFNGALVSDGFTMPADGEEVIIEYVQIATTNDVAEINKTLSVVTHNALNQLLDKNGVVMSNNPVVANQAALPSAVDYDGFCFRVANQGLYGVDYQASGGIWSPVNGMFLAYTDTSFLPGSIIVPATTFNGPYTLSTAAAGEETLITCPGGDVHGLTAAIAVNKYIYVSAGTGSGVIGLQRITAIAVDTTGVSIQIAHAFNGSDTITAIARTGIDIPLLSLTIPVLRPKSSIHFNAEILSDTPTASSRTTKIVWGGVEFISHNATSTNSVSQPVTYKINNVRDTSAQRGSIAPGGSGYVVGGANGTLPVTGAFNTLVETTFAVNLAISVANVPYEMVHYELEIHG